MDLSNYRYSHLLVFVVAFFLGRISGVLFIVLLHGVPTMSGAYVYGYVFDGSQLVLNTSEGLCYFNGSANFGDVVYFHGIMGYQVCFTRPLYNFSFR